MTKQKNTWLALVAISLGVSLIIMDATIVNVALPVVIRHLNLNATQAEWLNTIYALVFAALLLTTGKLGDNYGRRRLLLIGMAIFTLSSVGARLSQNGNQLIMARLFQGIGAAMILPATLSSINAIYTGKARSIAFAVWGATIGGMAAVGPLVGGWLTTYYSWRWAFLLNIPVSIIVITGVLLFVPETRDTESDRRIDWLGVFLSSFGLGALVFSLIEGQHYGWFKQPNGTISPVVYTAVAGAISVSIFIWLQFRNKIRKSISLVDVDLFKITSFRNGSFAALIVALGEFGLLFTLPLLLQNALGYSALGTGWMIVSLAVGTFVISGFTPQLTRRIGSKHVVQIGLAVEALAIGLLAVFIRPAVQSWEIAALLFLYGLGVGMATAQLTSVILTEIPKNESGQGSGLQSTFRQLGSALGVAILGSVLITTLGSYTSTHLATTTLSSVQQAAVVQSVKQSAGSSIPALQKIPATAEAGHIAADGLIKASRITSALASGIIVIGLISTRSLKSARR